VLVGTHREIDVEQDRSAIVASACLLQLEHDVARHSAAPVLRFAALIDESGQRADPLDHFVVVVLDWNEFGAIENGEQLGIVDPHDRRL
jgi:hypothetical protein